MLLLMSTDTVSEIQIHCPGESSKGNYLKHIE